MWQCSSANYSAPKKRSHIYNPYSQKRNLYVLDHKEFVSTPKRKAKYPSSTLQQAEFYFASQNKVFGGFNGVNIFPNPQQPLWPQRLRTLSPASSSLCSSSSRPGSSSPRNQQGPGNGEVPGGGVPRCRDGDISQQAKVTMLWPFYGLGIHVWLLVGNFVSPPVSTGIPHEKFFAWSIFETICWRKSRGIHKVDDWFIAVWMLFEFLCCRPIWTLRSMNSGLNMIHGPCQPAPCANSLISSV